MLAISKKIRALTASVSEGVFKEKLISILFSDTDTAVLDMSKILDGSTSYTESEVLQLVASVVSNSNWTYTDEDAFSVSGSLVRNVVVAVSDEDAVQFSAEKIYNASIQVSDTDTLFIDSGLVGVNLMLYTDEDVLSILAAKITNAVFEASDEDAYSVSAAKLINADLSLDDQDACVILGEVLSLNNMILTDSDLLELAAEKIYNAALNLVEDDALSVSAGLILKDVVSLSDEDSAVILASKLSNAVLSLVDTDSLNVSTVLIHNGSVVASDEDSCSVSADLILKASIEVDDEDVFVISSEVVGGVEFISTWSALSDSSVLEHPGGPDYASPQTVSGIPDNHPDWDASSNPSQVDWDYENTELGRKCIRMTAHAFGTVYSTLRTIPKLGLNIGDKLEIRVSMMFDGGNGSSITEFLSLQNSVGFKWHQNSGSLFPSSPEGGDYNYGTYTPKLFVGKPFTLWIVLERVLADGLEDDVNAAFYHAEGITAKRPDVAFWDNSDFYEHTVDGTEPNTLGFYGNRSAHKQIFELEVKQTLNGVETTGANPRTWAELSNTYNFSKYIDFDGLAITQILSDNVLGKRAVSGFTIITKLAANDWGAGTQTIFARRTGSQEYQLRIVTGSLQLLTWSDLGLDSTFVGSIPFSNGEAGWVKVEHDVSEGRTTSYTSTDGANWTQLAEDVGTISPATVIDIGTSDNIIGNRGNSELFIGKMFYLAIYDQDERLIQEFNAGNGTYPNYNNVDGAAAWVASNGVAGEDGSVFKDPKTTANLLGPVSRFYLPSEGEVPITPAIDATTWGSGEGPDFFRAPLGLGRLATPQVDRRCGSSRCGGQWVSPPLAAQTISGTADGQMMGKNHSGSRSWVAVVMIRVMQSDGVTVRGTLLDGSVVSTGMYPMAEGSDPHRNEPLLVNQALSSVVCEEGDFLVVEFGVYRTASWGSGDYWNFRTGDDLEEDLPVVANNVTDEVIRNPWIEFSNPIEFL